MIVYACIPGSEERPGTSLRLFGLLTQLPCHVPRQDITTERLLRLTSGPQMRMHTSHMHAPPPPCEHTHTPQRSQIKKLEESGKQLSQVRQVLHHPNGEANPYSSLILCSYPHEHHLTLSFHTLSPFLPTADECVHSCYNQERSRKVQFQKPYGTSWVKQYLDDPQNRDSHWWVWFKDDTLGQSAGI